MKNNIFILNFSKLSVFSQTDSKQVKTSMYIGAGLSMANSKGQAFDVTSYQVLSLVLHVVICLMVLFRSW
jgi:hypothetical protein